MVAIARDDKLVHYKGCGQLDSPKDTPIPLDAVSALASMTKPMAAVAGLMLLEQRRSPLQAKLADYYPVFADMKVGMPQADGSLKLGAQVSPIYIHDLYRVRFAPQADVSGRSVFDPGADILQGNLR